MTRMTFAPVAVLLLAGCAEEVGSPVVLGLNPDVDVVDPVDILAPVIRLDPEVRGGWADAGPYTISGTVEDRGTGVAAIMVGDANVVISEDGSFSAVVEGEVGLNQVRILAVDLRGNVAKRTVSWLAGRFMPSEVKDVPAVGFRMGGTVLHSAAFDAAEAMVDQLVPLEVGDTLSAFEDCVVLDGAVSVAQLGTPAVAFTATAEGLRADISFSTLTVASEGLADACGIELDYTATLTHPSPVASALLTLRAARGSVVAEVSALDIVLDGAQVFSPELHDELQLHGLSLNDIGLIEEVQEALRVELEAELPAYVEDAIAGYLPSTPDFGELPGLESRVWLTDIVVSPEEVEALYMAAFVPRDGQEPPELPGWLVMSDFAPVAERSVPVQQDVSLTAINRALYAYWATDTFSSTVPFARALGGEKLEALSVRPTLPPLIQAEGEQLRLSLGEVEVKYLRGEAGTVRGTYRVQISVPVDTEGRVYGEPSVAVDVVGGQGFPVGAEAALQQALAEAIYPRIPRIPQLGELAGGVAVQPQSVAGGQIVEGWIQSGGDIMP